MNNITIYIRNCETGEIEIRKVSSLGIHPDFVSVHWHDDNGEYQVESIRTSQFYVCAI